ncbi:MAG TPA: hypothetical protein PLX89_25510 [Verrucomicrobiota bacterium]|nr:hypothetical protein [Verrucomicrobiota bacterium]
MSNFVWAAAAADLPLPRALDPESQSSLRGIVPVLLAIGVVVLAVIGWAVFIRRSPKYRRAGALLEGAMAPSPESRRRRRRRRKEHRSRNPTRAEAGGLPPPGTGGSEPPPL